MATIKYLAQFNKMNKKFITVMSFLDGELYDELNHEHYLYRHVEMDIETQEIKGDYDNFKVVSIADEPLEVKEFTLNALARDKIVRKYPLEKQIGILGSTIETVAKKLGVPCEDLIEMNDFIREVLHENKLRKEFYAEDPDYNYLTTEQEEEDMMQKHEGGILEFDARIDDLDRIRD